MKKSTILLLSVVLSPLVVSNPSFAQPQAQLLLEYNKEKNSVDLYWFDSDSNSYTQFNCSGKMTKKKGKSYLKCDDGRLMSSKEQKLEYSGFYPEEKCMDMKLNSILFNGRWLLASDDILLDYSGNRTETICLAGKDTADEGLYKLSADNRWEKLSTSAKGFTIQNDEEVTVKRSCQTVKKGANTNILIDSAGGSIRLKFNKIVNK